MAPTATAEDHDNDRIRLERRISREAADEGHDADIPSGEEYVLTANEEEQRRASLAERRRKFDVEQHPRPRTTARDPSPAPRGPAETDHIQQHPLERDFKKGAGGAQEQDPGSGSGSGTSPSTADDDDLNVVWWEENDLEHPYNWPKCRTFFNCLLVSTMVFITPLASCKPPPTAKCDYWCY